MKSPCKLDLTVEQLIPLKEVPKLLPRRRGKKVHYITVYRWTSKGTKNGTLESVKLGRRLYTSMEALQRFLASSNRSTTLEDRQRKIEDELANLGV